jgi:GH25 family lysozyme M1 (1,4-beta-N-acetylmuramidase)
LRASPAPPAFVYLKATEGGAMAEPVLRSQLRGANAQGMLCGA